MLFIAIDNRTKNYFYCFRNKLFFKVEIDWRLCLCKAWEYIRWCFLIVKIQLISWVMPSNAEFMVCSKWLILLPLIRGLVSSGNNIGNVLCHTYANHLYTQEIIEDPNLFLWLGTILGSKGLSRVKIYLPEWTDQSEIPLKIEIQLNWRKISYFLFPIRFIGRKKNGLLREHMTQECPWVVTMVTAHAQQCHFVLTCSHALVTIKTIMIAEYLPQ